MEEEILVGWLEPGATSSESWTLGLNNKYWVFFWTMLANDIYILKKKMIQQMFDDVIRTKGTWTMNITHFFSNHFWAVSCCVNVPWCLFLKRSSVDPTTPAGIFLSQILSGLSPRLQLSGTWVDPIPIFLGYTYRSCLFVVSTFPLPEPSICCWLTEVHGDYWPIKITKTSFATGIGPYHKSICSLTDSTHHGIEYIQ